MYMPGHWDVYLMRGRLETGLTLRVLSHRDAHCGHLWRDNFTQRKNSFIT